ncbi:MFS transporter, partial [Nocardioides sp.]|uniref:MFS transporter n=1 Tax=Nocardioides sp. TaxID=35761 RepID=UPI002EDB6BAE
MTLAASRYDVGAARRWAMLGASTLAQAATAVMVHGPAFLIPTLHAQGMSLTEAGLVAAAPTLGVMLTLVAWGAVTDRRGERFVLLCGLGVTTVAGAAGALTDGTGRLVAALFLAGAGAASTNAASGRVVVGWFPPLRRGLAMGVRQMAQPAGVGVA